MKWRRSFASAHPRWCGSLSFCSTGSSCRRDGAAALIGAHRQLPQLLHHSLQPARRAGDDLPWLAPRSALGRFFSRLSVRTATATYIVIVAVTYHLVLRELWDPKGWQWVADNLLHYVAPALFLLDWLVFTPKTGVEWRNALLALVFPLVFIGWTFVHGAYSGWYPYPFVDVAAFGWARVLRNSAAMLAALIVLGLVFAAIARIDPGDEIKGLALTFVPRLVGNGLLVRRLNDIDRDRVARRERPFERLIEQLLKVSAVRLLVPRAGLVWFAGHFRTISRRS